MRNSLKESNERSERDLTGDPYSQVAELESLYKRFGQEVYTLCLRLLANESSAELATIEVFLGFARGITANKDNKWEVWSLLRRLAVQGALNRLSEGGSLVEQCQVQFTLPADGRRLANIKPSLLEELICQLPAILRVAYVLHDLEGLDLAPLAEWLGVVEAEAHFIVRQARMELRRLCLLSVRDNPEVQK
jgi:DNA-directed RNA polymerase specialized sigma24 family protein